MIKMRLSSLSILLFSCLFLAACLTGCGDGRVESTVSDVVSRIGNDMDNVISRTESAMDGVNSGWESRLESGTGNNHGVNSNLDSEPGGYSSRPGTVESTPGSGLDDGYGYDGENNGAISGGNLDADLADDGIAGNNSNNSHNSRNETSSNVARDR